MEYLDLYDRDGNALKKTLPRGTRLASNEYFKVVHVWLCNHKGQYFIQKRAKASDPVPYLWATTTGLVASDENPLSTAIRETKEELGIVLTSADLTHLSTIRTDSGPYHTITSIYIAAFDLSDLDIKLNPSEVSDTKIVSLETIKEMIRKRTFWDYPRLLDRTEYFKPLESWTQT